MTDPLGCHFPLWNELQMVGLKQPHQPEFTLNVSEATRRSVEGCDTARQTQDNHIEGEDSTTGLESESRTTEQFKLLPCGKCLSHQIPRKRNWTGLRTTLTVITPFPLPPSHGRISSPKVCTCLEKSCQPKRDSYRERKWPFSALGFFRLSMLRWHIYSAMDTCQLTGKHLDSSHLTV